MTQFAYQRDAYLKELDTEIVEVGVDDGRPYAMTADTVFYPEGGGQPADHGTMIGVDVIDVRKVEDSIRHFLSGPVEPGPVRLRIDWSRRYDHMQQHTAQHIITALALKLFRWPTTAFHLGPTMSDIELDVRALDAAELRQLEDAVNSEVRGAHPVSTFHAKRDEMGELGVRSRLLPHEFADDEVRLVKIEGVDLNTCGGTHVRSTAEIGTVALLGTESMRGGTRVFFVAGDRVRQRLAEHETRNLQLRSILDTADADLPEIIKLRVEKEKRLARDRRRLAEELIEAIAQSVAPTSEKVVSRHWDDRDMDFLQKLGRRLVEVAPDKVALLTAGSGREGFFVVANGSDTSLDVTSVGPEVAGLLDGRGGGARNIFQGKAAGLDNRDAAAKILRSRLSGS